MKLLLIILLLPVFAIGQQIKPAKITKDSSEARITVRDSVAPTAWVLVSRDTFKVRLLTFKTANGARKDKGVVTAEFDTYEQQKDTLITLPLQKNAKRVIKITNQRREFVSVLVSKGVNKKTLFDDKFFELIPL